MCRLCKKCKPGMSEREQVRVLDSIAELMNYRPDMIDHLNDLIDRILSTGLAPRDLEAETNWEQRYRSRVEPCPDCGSENH